MPPRFTLTQPQQPPTLTGRFTQVTPSSRFTQTGGSPSKNIDSLGKVSAGLGLARGVTGFGAGINRMFAPTPSGPQGIGFNYPTASGALQTASGITNLARGNTIPGALQTAGGLTSLGGTAGLIPSGVAGPASAALGLGSGAYDLVKGGSGQELAMGMAGLANPAFSSIYSASQLMGMMMNAAAGQGMFGQTPLPIAERGRGFSSAENAPSQISKMRGIQGAQYLQQEIEQTNNPMSLLNLASMGGNANWSSLPTGEIQFTHKDTPTPAAYSQLWQAAQTGEPNALRKFISGVSIQTGEGGATKENYALTDWYRRQLVSSIPETHPLRRDLTGLFEPTPQSYLEPLQYLSNIDPSYFALGGGLDRGFSPEDLTSQWGSQYAPPMLSAFGRTPQEMSSLQALHEKSTAIRQNPDFAQYIDRQTYPGYYPVGGMEGEGAAIPWPSQVAAGFKQQASNISGLLPKGILPPGSAIPYGQPGSGLGPPGYYYSGTNLATQKPNYINPDIQASYEVPMTPAEFEESQGSWGWVGDNWMYTPKLGSYQRPMAS